MPRGICRTILLGAAVVLVSGSGGAASPLLPSVPPPQQQQQSHAQQSHSQQQQHATSSMMARRRHRQFPWGGVKLSHHAITGRWRTTATTTTTTTPSWRHDKLRGGGSHFDILNQQPGCKYYQNNDDGEDKYDMNDKINYHHGEHQIIPNNNCVDGATATTSTTATALISSRCQRRTARP